MKVITVTTILETTPPIAPSTVFLGLILGQSLCFPQVTPTKYAPISQTEEKLRSNSK